MRVTIFDIPSEGRDIEVKLEPGAVSERVHGPTSERVDGPPYTFLPGIGGQLHLSLEGSTVVVTGRVFCEFETICARCAEAARGKIDLPLTIALKPRSGELAQEEFEDLSIGYYSGDEIDCSCVVEDALVLAIPFTVYCQTECLGLCPQCGVNKNNESCKCMTPQAVAPGKQRPFEVLKGIKVN